MATFKIPSLDYLFEEIKRVTARFPLTILSAVGLTTITLIFIHGEPKGATMEILGKLTAIFAIAIPLFVAVQLRLERERILPAQKIMVLGGFVVLLCVYFLWLSIQENSLAEATRYIAFNVVAHLLVAFLPFVGKDEEHGFWTFNFLLFLRTILTAIYCGVALLGILGAIGAVQLLFALSLPWQLYTTIAVFIGILMNNFILLSGIPQDLGELNDTEFYPNGLKIFTQYLLIPLITVYGLILYAYGVMILVNWKLPQGLIIGLMIVFCVASMFALLLIHPVRERAGNQWIKWFSKGFYIAILPLMALYFIAIGKRLLEYGFTEDRYFVVLAGLWLVGMAIYFIVAQKKRAILIPLTLSMIILASVVGPWSAYAVSRYSQVARFGAILTKNAVLTPEGKIDTKRIEAKKISAKDAQEIRSIVQFLTMRNKSQSLQPYFKDDLSKITKKESDVSERILGLMGADLAQKTEKYAQNEYKTFMTKDDKCLKVTGYKYVANVSFNQYGDTPLQEFKLEKGVLSANLNKDQNRLDLTYQNKPLASLQLKTILDNVWKKENTELNPAELTLQAEAGKYKIKLVLTNIQAQKEEDASAYTTLAISGNILLDIEE